MTPLVIYRIVFDLAFCFRLGYVLPWEIRGARTMNPGTRKSEKGERVAARTSACEADEEKKERARRDQIKETSIKKTPRRFNGRIEATAPHGHDNELRFSGSLVHSNFRRQERNEFEFNEKIVSSHPTTVKKM